MVWVDESSWWWNSDHKQTRATKTSRQSVFTDRLTNNKEIWKMDIKRFSFSRTKEALILLLLFSCLMLTFALRREEVMAGPIKVFFLLFFFSLKRCILLQLPPLFDGCFFFLLGSFKSPSKDELARLLREGGGQLLSRRPKPDSDVTQTLSAAAYHALPGSDQALCTQYIIFDPRGHHRPAVVRRGKVWSAPSTWIVDCIAAFCLLPVPDPQALD